MKIKHKSLWNFKALNRMSLTTEDLQVKEATEARTINHSKALKKCKSATFQIDGHIYTIGKMFLKRLDKMLLETTWCLRSEVLRFFYSS